MKMFTPFAFRPDDGAPAAPRAPPQAPPPPGDDALADLKKQMAAMQAQIAELSRKT
jgi:polyhydroxyalkanoate synthesis regulator protein